MKRILLLLFLVLAISCTPGKPRYHIAQQVKIENTECTGVVLKANYGYSRHEWKYLVGFQMKCASCKKTPKYLNLMATIWLPESSLLPTPPFDKKKISNPAPLKKPVNTDK